MPSDDLNDLVSRFIGKVSFLFPKWNEEMCLLMGKHLFSLYGIFGGAYHNLNHVKQCLKELDGMGEKGITIEMALWFHDIICIPGRKDNEERSAKWFESYIKVIAPRLFNDRRTIIESASVSLSEDISGVSRFDIIKRLILATKHNIFPNTHEDEKVIVDIDLSILGQPEDVYDKYSAAIREEYCPGDPVDNHMKISTYKIRREDFLYSLLPPKRPQIYQTDYFGQKYEEQAQKNIRREIRRFHEL